MAKQRLAYSLFLCAAISSCSFNPFSSENKAEDNATAITNEQKDEQAKAETDALEQEIKAEAEKAKQEAAAKAKKLADEKAKQEAAAKAKKLADEKAKQEAAAKAKKLADEKTKQEAAAKAKKLADEKAKQEAAAKAKKLADEKAKQEAAAKAKKLADEKAKQEAAAKAKKLADEKAKKLADEKAKQDAEEKAAKAAAASRAAIVAKAKAKSSTSSSGSASGPNEYYRPSPVSKTKAVAMLDSDQYTGLGAEKKGNISGSIPAWSGSLRGASAGMSYNRRGKEHPDPYQNEKPLFTITSANMERYAARLSEGQKALFKKYPDSYVMHIYPSHRDGRPNKKMIDRTKWNATRTRLVNGLDGMQNYTGGAPFPFPRNGAEALWNARIIHPHPTIVGKMDDYAVYLNGNKQLRRQNMVSEFPFAYAGNEIGKTDTDISLNAGLIHVTIEEPKRLKGQMTIVHEALDQEINERKAWVYLPGPRRVRRAPTVGFDTPDGPGGLVTVDDSLGFNGAMIRFNWKLLGKKEVYIPYHNYKFDTPGVSFDQLLTKGHPNPEFMRYELHRVWVVEANLKNEARHIYAKRRFYIDEDSWQFSLVESYDGRGDLWRVGVLNTIYDFSVKAYVARAQVFHDLQTGAYVAMRLINQTSLPNYLANPKGENYYSPGNLRKMAR